VEIVHALRPALASAEGSMLLALYSPYARRGDLWKQHTRHFGKDGDPVLCWQSPALTMNPSLAAEIVENAYLEDESATQSRMGAELRSDLEHLFDFDAFSRCVVPDRIEPSPV
jgi:hypothetical protein